MDDKTAMAHVKRLLRESRDTTQRYMRAAYDTPSTRSRAKTLRNLRTSLRSVNAPGVIVPPEIHGFPEGKAVHVLYLEESPDGKSGFHLYDLRVDPRRIEVAPTHLCLSLHGLQRLFQLLGSTSLRTLRPAVLRALEGLTLSLEDGVEADVDSIQWVDVVEDDDVYIFNRHRNCAEAWILITTIRGEVLSKRRLREIEEEKRLQKTCVVCE